MNHDKDNEWIGHGKRSLSQLVHEDIRETEVWLTQPAGTTSPGECSASKDIKFLDKNINFPFNHKNIPSCYTLFCCHFVFWELLSVS